MMISSIPGLLLLILIYLFILIVVFVIIIGICLRIGMLLMFSLILICISIFSSGCLNGRCDFSRFITLDALFFIHISLFSHLVCRFPSNVLP